MIHITTEESAFCLPCRHQQLTRLGYKVKRISTRYVESATAVLSFRKTRKKEWITPDTWKKIEERPEGQDAEHKVTKAPRAGPAILLSQTVKSRKAPGATGGPL